MYTALTTKKISVRSKFSQLVWPLAFSWQNTVIFLSTKERFLWRCLKAPHPLWSHSSQTTVNTLVVHICERQHLICVTGSFGLWVQTESLCWVTAGSATFLCWQTNSKTCSNWCCNTRALPLKVLSAAF